MTLIIKFIIDCICGVCFSVGGHTVLWMRRYLMPVIIGISASILTHVWWIVFMVLPSMGTLCLGYKGGKSLIRGGWMALQALVIGLGLFLTHHLAWYFYVLYVIISGIFGATLFNISQVIGDAIFGCWLGVILFIVR